MTNTTLKPNRLINELSPYLLQHAYNPVNWWPWCEQAFAAAKAEDKPVFLSIGYSTCHWCHVMEQESFEDPEVASILNNYFAAIKVDREERPDVDEVYMNACVNIAGSGGWPLTVFINADRKPFFAGTYFPKNNSYGRIGLINLLQNVTNLWNTRRDDLSKTAEKIISALETNKLIPTHFEWDNLDHAEQSLLDTFDSKWGGFGRAPKFPAPHNLLFLLSRVSSINEETPIGRAIIKTLKALSAGGIRDHIGGGFCRYSTDEKFLVPHFEKMLYDNALLLMVFAEAWKKSNIPDFAEIVNSTLAYINRELLSPGGGYYTAQDADIEGIEGKYYLWTPDEISTLLGSECGKRYCALLDITPEGNFEGYSIPNKIGKIHSADDSDFITKCHERLYEARLKRIHPATDDKILLTSNSLMLAALSIVGKSFADRDIVSAAEKTAAFILENFRVNSRLMAVFKNKRAYQLATLDGYAYLVWGLIELFDATNNKKWLKAASELNQQMLQLFATNGGGLYYSGQDVNDLPIRPVSFYDGATPSGTSVAARNLIRLSSLTPEKDLTRKALDLINSLGAAINRHPTSFVYLLLAVAEGVNNQQFKLIRKNSKIYLEI